MRWSWCEGSIWNWSGTDRGHRPKLSKWKEIGGRGPMAKSVPNGTGRRMYRRISVNPCNGQRTARRRPLGLLSGRIGPKILALRITGFLTHLRHRACNAGALSVPQLMVSIVGAVLICVWGAKCTGIALTPGLQLRFPPRLPSAGRHRARPVSFAIFLKAAHAFRWRAPRDYPRPLRSSLRPPVALVG
jgi:hypothetical protein